MADRKVIKTFTLSEPINDFDGEQITQVRLSKARGKDFRRAGAATNDFDLSLRLLASMSGLSDDTVDEIDSADLMPILEYIGERCLGKAPPASGAPSASTSTSLAPSPGSTDGRPAS